MTDEFDAFLSDEFRGHELLFADFIGSDGLIDWDGYIQAVEEL